MADEPRPYANTACPYCSVELDPLPKAKKWCPGCGQPIYVRGAPDGLTYLLRDADLAAHEARWAGYRSRSEWIRDAAPFVDEPGFEAIERELQAKDARYSPRDVYWVAADRALLIILRSGDWQVASEAYRQMAMAAYKEADTDEMPERAVRLRREASKATLRAYLRDGTRRVDIFACDCPRCSVDTGSIDIRRELEAPHIPHADCHKGWCSCDYSPVIE